MMEGGCVDFSFFCFRVRAVVFVVSDIAFLGLGWMWWGYGEVVMMRI